MKNSDQLRNRGSFWIGKRTTSPRERSQECSIFSFSIFFSVLSSHLRSLLVSSLLWGGASVTDCVCLVTTFPKWEISKIALREAEPMGTKSHHCRRRWTSWVGRWCTSRRRTLWRAPMWPEDTASPIYTIRTRLGWVEGYGSFRGKPSNSLFLFRVWTITGGLSSPARLKNSFLLSWKFRVLPHPLVWREIMGNKETNSSFWPS